VFLTQNGGAELTHQDIEDLGHAPPNHLTACLIDGIDCLGTLHRHKLQWDASNLDSPDGFTAYRTRGLVVNGSSVITTLTATPLPASATGYEDGEELPNGVDFTYFTKALFGDALTAPSVFARVRAVNVAPTAVDDAFSGAGIVAGNVLTNDTDADLGPNGKSGWTAVLVSASGAPVTAPAGLTFGGNGGFSYNTAGGTLTFYYRIDTGVWTDGTATADMSPDSNIAKVTITAPLPPPPQDVTAPKWTSLTVSPNTIWSPNGKKVAVTVKGTVTDNDNASESGIASVYLTVTDEYGLDRPAPQLLKPGSGLTCTTGARSCSLTVTYQLTASRNGSDKDGRLYTIKALAKDVAGNETLGPTLSVTAHDQSK
jgi:hypothetical protein